MSGIKDASGPDVIRSVGGLNVDKKRLSADLETFGQPHAFLTKTEQHQALICRGCGIDGFRDQIVDALKHKERLDVTTNPLYQELLRALQSPHFMREGGTLGFFCQHKYTDLSTDLEEFSPFLKGGDAIVYQIAKSLHLEIALKPIVTQFDEEYDYDNEEYSKLRLLPISDYDDKDINFTIPRFESHQVDSKGYGEHVCNDVLDRDDYLRVKYPDMEKAKGIIWCRHPEQSELILSTLEYGNSPSVDLIYQSAAFLVEVPGFGQRTSK